MRSRPRRAGEQLLLLLTGALLAGATVAAPEPPAPAADNLEPDLRRGRWLLVSPSTPLPEDVEEAHGRTRWDLTSLTQGTPYEQTLRVRGDRVSLLRDSLHLMPWS